MKKYIIAITVLFAGFSATAQQLQTSSVYELQGVLYNPANAGVSKNNFAGVSYRTQWSSISDAPKTGTVFGSFAVPKYKMGISGYLYNDKTGPTSRTGIQISVAKHIKFDNGANLSLGIATTFQQMSINRNKLIDILGASDPAVANADNSFNFDAGFGISYNTERLQLGASVAQLLESKLDFYKGNLNRSQEAKLYRHYYLHGKYTIDLDDQTTITPNLLWIYLPNAPSEFQIGATVEHFNLFWWGVGLRSKSDVMLSAGIRIQKKFSIGYCFDIYNTPISGYQAGANGHEVALKYEFIK
jgi:type IX secretion system PorP/SprF family membrane protein